MQAATVDVDIFQIYTLCTSAWLSIQAAILLLNPSFVVYTVYSSSTTATTPNNANHVTDFALYTTRTLAGTLLTLALINLIAITRAAPPPLTASSNTPPSLWSSVLPLTTLIHAATAIYGYTEYTWNGGWAVLASMVGSGGLAVLGGAAILFGREGRPSEGSRWPFESAGARAARKEKWKGRAEEVKKEVKGL